MVNKGIKKVQTELLEMKTTISEKTNILGGNNRMLENCRRKDY